MSRRWLVPEVIQTSAMDCGPAVLKAALEGFGVPINLGRLREACQTDVDGTSIDTLQALAGELGMAPVQTLVPVDNLRHAGALQLPALLVLARPDGINHFVLLWRAVGPWVQLMDPSGGRQWRRWRDLLPEVYRHSMRLPEAVWVAWLGAPAFHGGLLARLREMGVSEDILDRIETPEEAADLDAAVRTAAVLHAAGGVRRGAEAERLISALCASPSLIPAEQRATIPDGTIRGAAVVLQISAPASGVVPGSEDLQAALRAAPERPLRSLLRMVSTSAPGIAWWAAAVAVGGAVSGIVQAALLRAVLDAGRWLQAPSARLLGAAALVSISAVIVGIGWGWSAFLARAARRLEMSLRCAFHARLPLLNERYFASRLNSDLAERAHAMSALRALPTALAGVITALGAVLGSLAGLAWLDPGLIWLVLLSGASAVVLPVLIHPHLANRELRRQTLDGALSRSYLGAMVGARAVRAHNAEESIRRDHESLLARWQDAARDALVASVFAGAVQSAAGMGLAAWMVIDHLQRADQAGAVLLLIYWAVGLPRQGQALADAARSLPALQGVALRILETIEAPARSADIQPLPAALAAGAVGIRARGVRATAGGQVVLALPELDIQPGEHVAIVGPSGAGKSTLVGLLLGWREASAGTLHLNGVPLVPGLLPALRRRIAWVDPTVRLWNSSLLANLRYGQESASIDVGPLLERAELEEVLAQIPGGLSGALGEAGGLLSGGQGQRVRLGRALGRPDVGLVLLDEPFRGLDRGKRRSLLAASRAHWQGATVLCVTHDVSDTRSFSRVLVVDGGQIVEDGSPTALAQAGGLYATLLDSDRQLTEAFGADWTQWSLSSGTLEVSR